MNTKKYNSIKKSILIDVKSYKDLTSLSEENNTSKKGFIEASIVYFKKTGINPKDFKNESPSILIKAIDKRIVSFIKTQEKNISMPILDRSIESNEKFDKLIENLNNIFQKISSNEQNSQQSIKGIKQVLENIQSKL